MPDHATHYLAFPYACREIRCQIICLEGFPIHLTFSPERHEMAKQWLHTRLGMADMPAPTCSPCFAELLGEFFNGHRRKFPPLPRSPFVEKGTMFQKSVWERIAEIPYGERRTYKELAQALGNSGAARAVGQACNANPLALIVPCHRVTGSSGLGGFAGGQAMKKALLLLERETLQRTHTISLSTSATASS